MVAAPVPSRLWSCHENGACTPSHRRSPTRHGTGICGILRWSPYHPRSPSALSSASQDPPCRAPPTPRRPHQSHHRRLARDHRFPLPHRPRPHRRDRDGRRIRLTRRRTSPTRRPSPRSRWRSSRSSTTGPARSSSPASARTSANSSRFDQIPPVLLDATTAVEDKTFWDNAGFDPVAIISAAIDSFRGNSRGASTITQQLVRNRLLEPELVQDPDRTLERKLKEIIQSIRVTQAFPGETGKQEIITAYLNQNYYGNQATA